MKLLILICTLCTATIHAAELQASTYMSGTVTRDVAGGLARAKSAGKAAVVVTYEINGKESTYSLRGFFSIPETRKLLAANFVQIFAPWGAAGIAELRGPDDKTGRPVVIFIDKNGDVILRHAIADTGPGSLRLVQEMIAKIK